MISIEVKVKDEFIQFLKKFPEESKKALKRGFKKAVLLAESKAKTSFGKSGYVKVRTGRLRASIVSTVNERAKDLFGALYSNVIYAGVHEYGAVIKPKKGKYLTFEIGNRWVNLRKVVIPARPYLKPAVIENLDKMTEIIVNEIAKEI